MGQGDPCRQYQTRLITVFKQNSDQSVGFMALANLAHDKARASGRGVEI